MKIYILALILLLCSCAESKEIREERARHQEQTGERINQSQKNTDSLFKEIE
jgi:hypothetical protein